MKALSTAAVADHRESSAVARGRRLPWNCPALFDDMDGFHGVFSSQNYRDVIRVDEEKFTDKKRVEFLFSEETSIID